jgi:hypothetical protein
MGLKFWHLLVVGALAVSAVAAVVHIGRGATSETKTVASVATTMPAEIAKQAAAANVRSATPSLEAFHADHGTHGGADISALRRDYDPGIDPSVKLGMGRDRPLLPGEHGRGPDGERNRAQRRDRIRRLLNGARGLSVFPEFAGSKSGSFGAEARILARQGVVSRAWCPAWMSFSRPTFN